MVVSFLWEVIAQEGLGSSSSQLDLRKVFLGLLTNILFPIKKPKERPFLTPLNLPKYGSNNKNSSNILSTTVFMSIQGVWKYQENQINKCSLVPIKPLMSII